jgi:chromosome segregation ATPase
VGIVNTIALSSETVGGIPQTSVKLIANGDDPNSDGFRMKAILQSLKDANEPALDANNRLRDDANAAAQAVEDIKKKLFQARSDIDAQNQIINGQPTQQELDGLLENKRKAQAAVDHLNGQLDASTGPAQTGDAGLAKLRAQLASLKEQLQAAQDEQSAGISQARADLENAAKEFDDQLSSASAVLDKNSKLKDFFDSANQSQAKVRELINTLLVDGEDFEKQLEDVHREVNDAIQHRQEEKWNADPQLRDLLAQLGTVRRQFNALSSTGNADPKQLDDLKKQVDNWQTQVDARKAQLPVDAGEVKVSEGLDKLSTSLKYKLQLEREQIDQVLNPMEKQLAGLDPDVAALPDNQQDVARQLRQRLDGLNAARKQYAQAIASDQQSPSDKVLSLQKQIDDVKSQLDSPQADSDSQDVLQTALDSANKELQRAQKRADDAQAARGRVLDLGAQLNALNDSLTTATAAQVQKKELAEHAFDILPVSDNDVLVSATDARKDYCLYSIAVLAFVFAMLTMAAHASGNRDSEQQNIQNPPQAPVAVLPIAQKPRPEIRTQRQDSEDDADAVFLDDESGTMAVG